MSRVLNVTPRITDDREGRLCRADGQLLESVNSVQSDIQSTGFALSQLRRKGVNRLGNDGELDKSEFKAAAKKMWEDLRPYLDNRQPRDIFIAYSSFMLMTHLLRLTAMKHLGKSKTRAAEEAAKDVLDHLYTTATKNVMKFFDDMYGNLGSV